MCARTRYMLAALAATCAVAAVAPAAQAMTIRIGEPTMTGRVAISVPVAVSCTVFDPAFTHISDVASVSVEQAAGREIAYGSGYVSGSGYPGSQSPLLFACDGTEQTVKVPVAANTAGPPFHGGTAVINASASASAAQPCYPGATNCYTNFVSQTASSGPAKLHL